MVRLDNIGATELGERLRIARTNARISQEEAARALCVSRPTLVAIEKGQRKARPNEIEFLASFYGVSLNRLLASEVVSIDLQGRFRRTDVRQSDADEALAVLNRLASASVELEKMLGIRFLPAYPPEYPIGVGSIERQAEEAAATLRYRLGLGLAPIPDIVSLLESELGIRMFVRGLPSDVAGVFAYDPSVGACILLNAKHPWERRALTAAHECGHFMANRSNVDLVDINESLSTAEERFANAFAYAFLMPPTGVRRRFQEIVEADKRFTPRHLILMAQAFHVSSEAMGRQLERLQLLPQGTYDSMRARGFNREFVRGIVGDLAPTSLRVPVSPRLAQLVSSAARRELISEGQLASMLGMDRVEVRELIDVFGDEEEDDLGVNLL